MIKTVLDLEVLKLSYSTDMEIFQLFTNFMKTGRRFRNSESDFILLTSYFIYD